MWDQHDRDAVSSTFRRIIPTYVGSTKLWTWTKLNDTNHSHVCGINSRDSVECCSFCKSFPRMWDQLVIGTECENIKRIIPTYVGSTTPSIKFSSISFESFPRMWDQRYLLRPQNNYERIIPTYVGSTESGRSYMKQPFESFPRMWDQPYRDSNNDGFGRIIPTYVGSTQRIRILKFKEANHSHVCGINRPSPPAPPGPGESFPRMWDQLSWLHNLCTVSTNHSHVCGINDKEHHCQMFQCESFPRMWDQRHWSWH